MRYRIQNPKFRSQNPEYRRFGALRFASYALCLIWVLGCYGAETVRIRVGVDSKIDMSKYDTVAVMDFIDNKSSSATDQGKILARMIRKQLVNSKEIEVLNERSMYLLLDGQIDKNNIEDPTVLISICNQLGVGAIIVGIFDFRQTSQPMPYIVERYSPRTGRYTPETRTYIRKSYRFSFRAKVVDGKTGKTVFNYTPRAEDRPVSRTNWGLPLSGTSGSKSVSLRSIAVRSVTAFVLDLIPHYEYERRVLAQ